MTLEQIIATILSLSPFFFVKVFVLILLLLYLAFAFILLRQTQDMIKVIEAEISPTIVIFSLFHLLGAIFLFLLAIFTL